MSQSDVFCAGCDRVIKLLVDDHKVDREHKLVYHPRCRRDALTRIGVLGQMPLLPPSREQQLYDALLSVLVADGMLREDCAPSGPELLLAADEWVKHRKAEQKKSRRERVAIVGSRNFPRLRMVRDYVKKLPTGTIVVSGGARGVDSAAVAAAEARGLKTKVYLPNIEVHGTSAFAVRNRKIVRYADRVVAFMVDGGSRGTEMTLGFAREAGKPVKVYTPD